MTTIIYAQATYDQDFPLTKKCVERMTKYGTIDAVVIVEDGSLNESQRRWLSQKGCKVKTIEFRDNLPEMRNHYLAEAKKIDMTAWLCVSDPDELYCEELVKDLRKIINWAEKEGFNQLGINCEERFAYFEWLDELDKLKEIPSGYRQSNFWKYLIFKLSPDLMYEGVGETKNVHETWFSPYEPWRTINLPKKYYYTHTKSVVKIWRNAARNLFISGGGDNVGTLNPMWVKLREICNNLKIRDWRSFEGYLKKGNVAPELKKWLIEALQVRPTNYGIETRETAKYYFALHPEEITPEIEEKIKNPPKLTPELEVENYVMQQYFRCLGRHPDLGGLKHYTEAILSGKIARDELPTILMSSPEYIEKFKGKPIEAWVTKCYIDILERQPDEEGLRVYVDHIVKGRIRKKDLPEILRRSQEYRLRFGGG